MATKKRKKKTPTDWDITELIIELDSGMHSWEHEGISTQSDSDTADTNFTWWTDNTNCRPSVPIVHKFTGGSSGLWQTEAPSIIKDFLLSICILSFCFEITELLMEVTDIIANTWHSGWRTLHTSWSDCSGNVCVFGSYCAYGVWSEGHTEGLLVSIRTVLHGLLQKCYEMCQVLSYT